MDNVTTGSVGIQGFTVCKGYREWLLSTVMISLMNHSFVAFQVKRSAHILAFLRIFCIFSAFSEQFKAYLRFAKVFPKLFQVFPLNHCFYAIYAIKLPLAPSALILQHKILHSFSITTKGKATWKLNELPDNSEYNPSSIFTHSPTLA